MKRPTILPAIAAILFALLMLTPLSASAQFEKGEKSIGPKVGYVDKNKSASAGLVFQYSFSRHLRVAPEIGCIFKHKNMDAFTIDFNFHTPFTFTGEKAALYPLAGLNYSSWSRTLPKELYDADDDITTRSSRFGLNLGAGFELRCSDAVKIGIEAKYTIIKSYSGASVAALVSYIF